MYDDGEVTEQLSYDYDSAGRRTRAETPDVAGNIETDSASNYAYDARNHLESGQIGAETSNHTFTADGRRINTDRAGATAEVVLDAGGRRLAKLEGGVWRDYIYLDDRLIAYADGGASGATLVFTDHIGMPLIAVDQGAWTSRSASVLLHHFEKIIEVWTFFPTQRGL